MENIPNKTDGVDTLADTEFNSHKNELQTLVTESGQTLAIGTVDQLRKAVSTYGRAIYATDSSVTANVITAARPSSLTEANAYFDGMVVICDPANTNTGATTLKLGALATKKVRTANDTPLVANDIIAGLTYTFIYDATLDSGAGAFKHSIDLSKKTGAKNLIINSRKIIDQRSSGGGGLIQVVEADMNIGGEYTISFTGAATVTIYEFPALLADYATTIADGSTNTLVSTAASNTTVSTTSGYYIAISFSTTSFNNVQFEPGRVATPLEVRHNEIDLCERFYEVSNNNVLHNALPLTSTTPTKRIHVPFKTYKRATPAIAVTGGVAGVAGVSSPHGFRFTVTAATSAVEEYLGTWTADAEIFGTTETYKEDRWFI